MIEIKVEEKVEERIDKYISNQNKDLSRVMIKKLIDDGNIMVNNSTTKSSYRVKINDIITINIPKVKNIELKAQDIPLDIIYEDDDIIVINKQKGIVVHPANGNPDGTLVNAIMAHCKDNLSGIGGELRPGIIHRLDKDTSGILIVAKNDKSHINISKQIQERKVEKTYLALVRGNITENEATINMPIGRSTKDRKKMAVTQYGKEAITKFKVLTRFKKYTYLEVKIETGRTHQIRVHLAEIGHPVVGDIIYSNGKNDFNIEGQMLHAKSLKFKHPTSEKEMYLEAKTPKYFEDIIKVLENNKK